jgi:hypothetical protein
MLKNYHDEDYKPNNREKVLSPKIGLNWCLCDRTHAGDWEKCPICGKRNGRRRYKP